MAPFFATLLAVTALTAPDPVEAPHPVDALVNRLGTAYVEKMPYSLVVGVSTPRSRQIWGFGQVECEGKKQVPDGKTLYEIGSITKAITGTLLADLALAGEVQLDDPVSKHLPSEWMMPTRDGRAISLLHLTTHTSSLPRMPPGMAPFLLLTGTVKDPYSRYQEENLRVTLSQVKLDRPIGSQFAYSNLGVGLLGVALANATGEKDPADLLSKRILKPLGLADTTFTPSGEQLRRSAKPFDAAGGDARSWHFACLKTCGGLRSTVGDMLTYAEAAMGRQESNLLPAFEFAMQPWRQTCEGERSVGLGWFVQPLTVDHDSGRTTTRLVWHNGATGGYRSFLGVVPEHNVAIVALANSTRPVDPQITLPILKAILRRDAAVASGSE